MIIPSWAGGYVGIPYADKGRDHDGVDCWGLVRLVLAEQFGVDLPSYAQTYTTAEDGVSVAGAVQAGLRDGWLPADYPSATDLLILRVEGRPWHCALMVNAVQFLHAPARDRRGQPMLSCIDRIDSPLWRSRVEGLWRHPAVRTG